MKVINEKGKLFGVINLVDLLFILVVIAVLAGVGWKLGGDYIQEKMGGQTTMTVTLRVRAAMPSLCAEFDKASLEGQKLVAGNEYLDAEVKSYSIEPSRQYISNSDGQIVVSEDPERKDIIIVVESPVSRTTTTPKIGTQEIRAGRTMTFKVLQIETYASIESVIFND